MTEGNTMAPPLARQETPTRTHSPESSLGGDSSHCDNNSSSPEHRTSAMSTRGGTSPTATGMALNAEPKPRERQTTVASRIVQFCEQIPPQVSTPSTFTST